MTNSAVHHLVLHLFLVVSALQWAALHCQLTTWDTNNYAPSEGFTDDASFRTQISKVLPEEAIEATDFRTPVQSDGSYKDSTRIVADDFGRLPADQIFYNLHSFDNDNPDTPERFFDTSNATVIYSADTEHAEVTEKYDYNVGADKVVLLMPFQKEPEGCRTGNPIDDCWRCDPNWQRNRQALGSCVIGHGRNVTGGKNGKLYVVTGNGDDPEKPAPGSLRYGVTRVEPLWIIFADNMTIQLQAELLMTSNKTIDGRGATVHLVGGSQITIQNISNVIIHGIYIHDIRPSGPAEILSSPSQIIHRGVSDGDAIHIQASRNVWIDHCFLANAADGLVDCTHASTSITISNNYFTKHNKVMLLGSHFSDVGDRVMQITVAFNKFGPDLIQRMPRGRFGHYHVVNNMYTSGWGLYAIGGSEDPTILSQGNYFNAACAHKEVTKHIDDEGPTYGGWQKWNWASEGDVFLAGAYFTASGMQNTSSDIYAKAYSFSPRPGRMVPAITAAAGPLTSVSGAPF